VQRLRLTQPTDITETIMHDMDQHSRREADQQRRQCDRQGRALAGRRQLGGLLKGAAKQVLPTLAGAAVTLVGGGMIGSELGSAAGDAFGLELEGLSPEDGEYEVARRFVRIAGEAKQACPHALQHDVHSDRATHGFRRCTPAAPRSSACTGRCPRRNT